MEACPLTVVSGIFLSCDHGLRVEKRPVRTSLHVINDARLKINIERSRDVFAGTSLREKCLEAAIRVRGRAFLDTAIRLSKRSQKLVHVEPRISTLTLSPCSSVYNSPMQS